MIKDAENKAVKMAETKEELDFFFPDIDGRSITVKAKSREEAERKAKEAIKELN